MIIGFIAPTLSMPLISEEALNISSVIVVYVVCCLCMGASRTTWGRYATLSALKSGAWTVSGVRSSPSIVLECALSRRFKISQDSVYPACQSGQWLQIPELDSDSKWMRALDGSEYMPGLVGLNNMSRNDYVNVIVEVCTPESAHCTRQTC